jgi:hypothetical protein
MAIGEFHQIGFAGQITLARNIIDEVIGRLHAGTGPGQFIAQMLCALCSRVLEPFRMKRTPDTSTYVINSSISAFVRESSASAIVPMSSQLEMEAKSWRM